MPELDWIEPHEQISTIGGVYSLGRKLGCGSFGHVYLVVNSQTGQEYAAKVEMSGTKNPMIPYEAKLLRRLQGATGFPSLYYWGEEASTYNVMVMDLLGPSLKDLFYMCRQKFSVKTSLLLADQMIFRIEYLHSKGFVHRDIKPENFLVEGRRASVLYMIDFGLVKRYRSAKTQTHIAYRDGKSLTGTARYASINAHIGIQQSRRDDVEAVGYVLIYFLQGGLPWQQLQTENKDEKYKKIMEAKKATPLEELCKGLPEVFTSYMHYCRGLEFEDKPDYAYLRRTFKEAFLSESFVDDGKFDWMQPQPLASSASGQPQGQAGAEREEKPGQPPDTAASQNRGRPSSKPETEPGLAPSLHQRMVSMFSQTQSTLAPHAADRPATATASVASSETGRNIANGKREQPRRKHWLASIFCCGSKQQPSAAS